MHWPLRRHQESLPAPTPPIRAVGRARPTYGPPPPRLPEGPDSRLGDGDVVRQGDYRRYAELLLPDEPLSAEASTDERPLLTPLQAARAPDPASYRRHHAEGR